MQPYYAKRKKSKISFYTGTVLLVLLCVFWVNVRSYANIIISPIMHKIMGPNNFIYQTYNNLSLYIKYRQDLNDQIQKLSIDNIYLENEIAKINHVNSENAIKDELYKIRNTDSILAYGFGISSNFLYDYFIINVGYRDGVRLGAMVYTRGMQPVGKIKEVNNYISKVELLSKAGSDIDCILEINNEKITLTGQGGSEYTAKIKNTLLQNGYGVGNKVLLGEDTSMVVGEIIHIDSIKDEGSSVIHVRGYYNPASQSIFFVQK